MHLKNYQGLQHSYAKIQQTKMLVTCQRFGDLFLFGLVWQYSSVQTKYNKGRFKVMATCVLSSVQVTAVEGVY